MGAASNVTAQKISEIIIKLLTSTRENEKEITEKQMIFEEFNIYEYFFNIGENLAANYKNMTTLKRQTISSQ